MPTEVERPDAAKELYTQLDEVKQVLAGLDKQEQALVMLREGRLPQPKMEAPEPMVTTIEVRDPGLVKELEALKSQVSFLEDKLKTSHEDSIRISDLENENTDLQEKLSRYEAELEDARRHPPVVAAVALHASRESHEKPSASLDDRSAAILLQTVLSEIELIHNDLTKAPRKVEKRWDDLKREESEMKKKELESGGESSDESPRQTDTNTSRELKLSLTAVEMIKTGQMPDDLKALVPRDGQ